jgi:hypothetical protein
MTLRRYLQTHPTANRANVQRRVEYLISEMAGRGVSHGNLHDENIIVSVSPTGRIDGYVGHRFRSGVLQEPWKDGTERVWNQSVPGKCSGPCRRISPTARQVPVREGSRANVHMMNVVYGKRLSPSWERAIAARRKQVVEEMEAVQESARQLPPRAKSSRAPSPKTQESKSVKKPSSARVAPGSRSRVSIGSEEFIASVRTRVAKRSRR